MAHALGAVGRKRESSEEVTIARLLYALERWGDMFTPFERDEISHIIFALEEIAGGSR